MEICEERHLVIGSNQGEIQKDSASILFQMDFLEESMSGNKWESKRASSATTQQNLALTYHLEPGQASGHR